MLETYIYCWIKKDFLKVCQFKSLKLIEPLYHSLIIFSARFPRQPLDVNDLIDRVFTENVHDTGSKDYALQDSDYHQDEEYLIFSDDFHKDDAIKTSGITVRTVLEKASAKSSENLKIIDQLVNGDYIEKDYDQEMNDDIKHIYDNDYLDVSGHKKSPDYQGNTDHSDNKLIIDLHGSDNPYLTDYLNMNYLNDDLKTVNEHNIKKGILDSDNVNHLNINEQNTAHVNTQEQPNLNEYLIITDHVNDNLDMIDNFNTGDDHITSNDNLNIHFDEQRQHLKITDNLKPNDQKDPNDHHIETDQSYNNEHSNDNVSLHKNNHPQIKISNIYSNKEEPIEFNDNSQTSDQIDVKNPKIDKEYHYYPIEATYPQNGEKETKYKEIDSTKRRIVPKSLTDVLPHKNYYPLTETSIENVENQDIWVENESEQSYVKVKDQKIKEGKILLYSNFCYVLISYDIFSSEATL